MDTVPDESRKTVTCACHEPGCDCHNEVSVPKYVPSGTPIICEECQAEHPTPVVESTSL